MKIKIQKKFKSTKGLLIVPVFEENLKKIPSIYPKSVKTFIKTLVKSKEFKAEKGELVSTYLTDKKLPSKLAIIGCGKKKKYKETKAREIGGKIGKTSKGKKCKEVEVFLFPEMATYAKEIAEGIIFSQYQVDQYKTSKKGKKKEIELEKISLVIEKKPKGIDAELDKAIIIGQAVDYVKDLVNAPSHFVDAIQFEKEAKRIAKENRYKTVIMGNKELEKMGWGGLLAVNQGTIGKEAKCIVLEHDGAKNKREKPVVVVGKGIVFDTGGYNLKPTRYIETMHQDMAGAAVVMGLFEALKKLKIKKNVIGVIPIAENLISEKAYRPSDIITMFNGKTVEITNTDAEGRLILADGITYGAKLKPESIITVATLTGAVDYAVGDRYAGLIGNNLRLRRGLQKAGREVDELGWPLPLHRDYKKKMDSKIADIQNCDLGSSRHAGASKGAAFLERFVEKNKWCHIDIGGTAFTEDPKEYEQKGATAHGLRMLLSYLEK